MRRLPVLVLSAGLALGLSGCAKSVSPSSTTTDAPSLPASMTSSAHSSPESAQTSAAADSVAARDSSFGAVPPNAWVNETAKKSGTQLFLRGRTAVDRIYPTISVIRDSMEDLPSLDDLVQAGMTAQRQKGATVGTVAGRTIGGLKASGYTMTRSSGDHEVKQTQYYVVRGDSAFVITLTAAPKDRSADPALTGLLSTWSWGSAAATSSSSSGASTSTPSGQD